MRTPRARASRKPTAPTAGRASGEEDVSGTVAALYAEHYRPLVRLAVLLVSDLAAAEEIVQEAFADLHGTWRTLPTGREVWVRASAIHGGTPDAPPWYEVERRAVP